MATHYTKEDYQIGIICALYTEAAAMVAMLDKEHPGLPPQQNDPNTYFFGCIGVHNLVIACLPAGSMGNGPAAIVANNMRRSFPIKFGLMVGIGGGVPSKRSDIRLGDIAISQPTGDHGGVVQWDYGKTEQGGEFRRTGMLNQPPDVLLHALQALKTRSLTDGIYLDKALETMTTNKPRLVEEFDYQHQGIEEDVLFQASYDHATGDTCENCDFQQAIGRKPRKELTPRVFYGNIASGNQVMKHGVTRDKIAKKEGVICFEMEAAGLMNNFPCLVVRGICDYADSHKNKIWQQYAAATAAAFARVFLGFVKVQELIDIQVQQKYTILPFSRNPDFVGRDDIFERIDRLLPSSTTYQTAAIWGLGGCGKTQIALEYAYRWQKETSGSVFWVYADTEASFSRHYSNIARKAGLPSDLIGKDLLYAVQRWIEKQPKWLLLLDNADDLKIFKKVFSEKQPLSDQPSDLELLSFIPSSPTGTVIWTSRDKRITTKIAGINRGIEVGAMTTQQSLKLFRTHTENSVVQEPSEAEEQLFNLLERLPLAISQAAAFINTTRVSLSKYLHMVIELTPMQPNILDTEFDDPRRGNVPNSVMKTWRISMEHIAKENDCAARILKTIAFLDNQSLPFTIISAAAGSSSDEIEVLLASGLLIDYSFLQMKKMADDDSPVYQEHRLVQLATRQSLSNIEKTYFSGMALQLITDLFPNVTYKNWDSCKLYLPHALKSVIWKDADSYKDQAPNLLGRIGVYYWEQGRFDKAEQFAIELLDLRKSVLGEKHPNTISAMTNLALTSLHQGQVDKAERLGIQVLDLGKSVLGEKHPVTLDAMANLATISLQQGQLYKAEQLGIEVLDLRKSVLGEKHADTIGAMATLAAIWLRQGQLDKARQLQIAVLDLRKSAFGEKHPDTISAMANLAVTWLRQGQVSKAEQLQIEVLDLRKNVLREEHPDTISAMANLAATWLQQGQLDKAEQLQIEVLDLRKSVLGEKHPSTIDAMANLAAIWRQQGQLDKAEQLGIEVLDLGKSVLGKKHPDTIGIMANLAATWLQLGQLDKAERLGIEALDLGKSVLGEKHPDIIIIMAKLVLTWLRQGQLDKAEQLGIELLDLGKSVLGEKHPITIGAMANLALTWLEQGQDDKAEQLGIELLDLQKSSINVAETGTIQQSRETGSTDT